MFSEENVVEQSMTIKTSMITNNKVAADSPERGVIYMYIWRRQDAGRSCFLCTFQLFTNWRTHARTHARTHTSTNTMVE